jgi:hypothetical protein
MTVEMKYALGQLRALRDFKWVMLPALLFLSSCEKDITVDLPQVPLQLVVEGHH